MAAHARLKNEFSEDEKYHNLMTRVISSVHGYVQLIVAVVDDHSPAYRIHNSNTKFRQQMKRLLYTRYKVCMQSLVFFFFFFFLHIVRS